MNELWDNFCTSGKIEDYLKYCSAENADTKGVYVNAEDNNGSCSA